MGRKRRVLQETAARQLQLCPFNDRVGVAMQYVAKGHFQTWPACFLSEMATARFGEEPAFPSEIWLSPNPGTNRHRARAA